MAENGAAEPTPSPGRPLLLPQAIVRVLMVCLGYALLLAVVATLSVGFLPQVVGTATRGVLSVATVVVSAGVGPWVLWLMGDRAPVRLVLGGLAGIAAAFAMAATVPTPGASSLSVGVAAIGLASVLGVAAIGLALFLSRHEGFDERAMGVDGVLGQPERYSPVASASSVATLVLGAAMLLIAIGVALGLSGGLNTTSPVVWAFRNFAMLFASLGSDWLLVAGLVSLALVGLHYFRRSASAAGPDRT